MEFKSFQSTLYA